MREFQVVLGHEHVEGQEESNSDSEHCGDSYSLVPQGQPIRSGKEPAFCHQHAAKHKSSESANRTNQRDNREQRFAHSLKNLNRCRHFNT